MKRAGWVVGCVLSVSACGTDAVVGFDAGTAPNDRDATSVADAAVGPFGSCRRGSERGVSLRIAPEHGASSADLEGMATVALTGDQLTIAFDDGRTATATAGGVAMHVPQGRWQAKVHHNPHPFVPAFAFVLRAPDGTLEFAAWSYATTGMPDISPLTATYTDDDCAFPRSCGDYGG